MSKTKLTAEIVAAFVANNPVAANDLPAVIRDIHSALATLQSPVDARVGVHSVPTPAAVRKSIQPGYLVSFLDGGRYQMLRRHLTREGLTPDDYRKRFGLQHDYPMVAPNYSAKRSAIAKGQGLGQRR